jgi:hypothetical protein
MINHQITGCRVSPPAKSNSATTSCESATNDSTRYATYDLLALSTRVLERNNCNQQRNLNATSQPDRVVTDETVKATKTSELSCRVAFCKVGNHATQELRRLIEQVSKNHGGDDSGFLSEYIESVVRDWSHNFDAAIKYFSELAAQSTVKNSKYQEV